jgi:hypothetical protein
MIYDNAFGSFYIMTFIEMSLVLLLLGNISSGACIIKLITAVLY